MELLEYWRTIKKRLWLIVLLTVLAVASAIYWGQRQVPLYTTTTTLFLNPAASSPLLPYEASGSTQSLANTYMAYMRTSAFANLVAGVLDAPLPADEILEALATRLVPDTQFFQISATHPDPSLAQDLANSAARALIAENAARQQAQRQQIEAQRDPAATLERQQLVQLQTALQEELAVNSDQIAGLRAQIAELGDQLPSEDLDRQRLDLRQELANHQTLRVELYASLAQTQAALTTGSEDPAGLLVDTAVVVDPAPLPQEAQPRHLLRYALLAAVAAVGLGVALAFLLEYLDWTVNTPEALEALYGLPTLGVIGAYRTRGGGRDGAEPVIALAEPRSPVAEAFRALRTNLQFASPGSPPRSLLVTSAGPVEGKTVTAANLAVSLAQAGQRVILVDADLRRPRLHRLFDVDRQPGLTDLVAGPRTGLQACLHPGGLPNLWIMPCGPLPPNPAELLGAPRTAMAMAQLAAVADVVVYDAPPVATVADALVLSPRVDGVLHVVQAGGPRRDVVQRARDTLRRAGAPLLGTVLNRVRAGDLGYYRYCYDGNYHGENGKDPEGRAWWRRTLVQAAEWAEGRLSKEEGDAGA